MVAVADQSNEARCRTHQCKESKATQTKGQHALCKSIQSNESCQWLMIGRKVYKYYLLAGGTEKNLHKKLLQVQHNNMYT